VYFPTIENAEGQVKSGQASQTTLTGFMKLNQTNAVGANGRRARDLKYERIVEYFCWDKSKKAWLARKTKADAVGQIYSVSYLAGEKFYLRVLLLHRKNFRLFKELRTVDGVRADTYQIACDWLGLLVDNHLYNETLFESATSQTGYQLTEMFAMMCVHSPPTNTEQLFENHYEAFTDDCLRVDMSDRYSRLLRMSERRVLGLFRLESIMKEMEHDLKSCGVAISRADQRALHGLQEEKRGKENLLEVHLRLKEHVKQLNKSQAEFFSEVKETILNKKGGLFYLDGPGGTGKTFLLNTIIDFTTTKKVATVVSASSGVVALLLKDGQTSHSAFKIPLDTEKNVECPIEPDSQLALHLVNTRLIIWDEVVTIHMNCIDAVDRTLRTLTFSDDPFGGKVVIFAGDFRQILPVVKYNEFPPSDAATLRLSRVWSWI
jgi:hypothetical protein